MSLKKASKLLLSWILVDIELCAIEYLNGVCRRRRHLFFYVFLPNTRAQKKLKRALHGKHLIYSNK
jgi:hypothetical protein